MKLALEDMTEDRMVQTELPAYGLAHTTDLVSRNLLTSAFAKSRNPELQIVGLGLSQGERIALENEPRLAGIEVVQLALCQLCQIHCSSNQSRTRLPWAAETHLWSCCSTRHKKNRRTAALCPQSRMAAHR